MSFLDNVDFVHPWAFGLIPLPLLLLLLWSRMRRSSLVFSNLALVARPKSWRVLLRHLPKLILFCSWVAFCIALSGPRHGHEETRITTEGIAISMVIDASGSMGQNMQDGEGGTITRMEMVRKVFTDFVNGNKSLNLEGRPNDLIGLVSFDRLTDEIAPLTLDHDFVIGLLANKVAEFESLTKQNLSRSHPMSGTAAWEGVARGADMLRRTGETLKEGKIKGEGGYSIKSKVLILLTDGEDNASEIGWGDAARIANEFGIRVYSIAIRGESQIVRDFFGRTIRRQDDFDVSALQSLAQETGGKFYQATDPKGLAEVYEDIDSLEKTEVHKQVSIDYAPAHHPFLVAGFVLLLAGILFRETLFRELP